MANISFRSFLGLLFGIQSLLYAEGTGGMIEKHALIGQRVNLTCYTNSTEKVSWLYNIGENLFTNIYTCENIKCKFTAAQWFEEIISSKFYQIEATRRNDTSIISLSPSHEEEHDFKCVLGNYILQEYSVKSIGPRNIVPNCTVTMPSSNKSGVGSMTLSCEVNSGELGVNLIMEGIGLNVPDDSAGLSQSIKTKTLYFDDFNNTRNASCNAYFPDIDTAISCTYPNIIKAQYIVEGNDIIVECDDESFVDYWRLYGSDGREEDIKNRSWSRKGGRLLLIRDISERDVAKVVVCRTKGDDNQTNKGTIGFHVISKISVMNNNSNSEGPASIPSGHNPYLVLTLIFLTLWLITIAACGVWLGYRLKRSHEVSTIPRTSDDEQTQTTPVYTTVILSTNGRSDLDIEESTIFLLVLTMCFIHSGTLYA